MTPYVRTVYKTPWYPPPFQPSRSRGPIPRGTGVVGGGDSDRVGTITVVVAPPGAVAPGASVTLTAVRTGGSAPMTYQWYDPTDTPILGATGNSYTFTATTSGTYKVVVDSPGAVDAPVAATVAVVVTPPAAPWTPADLPGLETWFDAEEGITLNGANVVQWVSKGRTVLTVSQADAAKQPSLVTEGGKKYIAPLHDIDGLRATLTSAYTYNTVLGVADLKTPALVGKLNSIFGARGGNGRSNYLAIAVAQPGGYTLQSFNYAGSINGTALSGNDLLNFGNWQVGVDAGPGMCLVSASSVSPQQPASGVEFCVGSDIAFGGYDRAGFINGRIAQVVLLSTAISESDQQKFDGWAAHTYGATAKLPADHPYKTAPPTK